MPRTHILQPERKTLHGHFSRDLAPVLTIADGDTVRYSTLPANWAIEPFEGGPYKPPTRFPGRDAVLDDGHALVGPIAIENAKAGMTLEIEMNVIRPGAWGFTLAGGWPSDHNKLLKITERGIVHAWTLDADAMTGRNHLGHQLALHPFMGILGMPPNEPSIHSTVPPRIWGGNMDCKELVVGSKLYLPIPVDGALFSMGDGHAAQGDGEVSVNGIECPMEQVELTFHVRDDFPVTVPTANTPGGWVTMGFDTDLNVAMLTALEAMFALMERQHGLDHLDAVALASVAVDLHVTQIVNQVRGVHAILPHGRIQF